MALLNQCFRFLNKLLSKSRLTLKRRAIAATNSAFESLPTGPQSLQVSNYIDRKMTWDFGPVKKVLSGIRPLVKTRRFSVVSIFRAHPGPSSVAFLDIKFRFSKKAENK
jgi:hypothetical protein